MSHILRIWDDPIAVRLFRLILIKIMMVLMIMMRGGHDDDDAGKTLCIRCVLGEIKSSQGRNCAGGVCRIQNLPRDQKTSLEKDQDDDHDRRASTGDDDDAKTD